MNTRIYLDNNSTTALDPSVQNVMINYLKSHFGNPSSVHSFGQEARNHLSKARQVIASYLHVKPQEIIFTSSGTEGFNSLLQGFFEIHPKGHLITSSVEHSCVYKTAKQLAAKGWSVTFLDPGEWGAITPEAIKQALQPSTCLIALMAVNNETGVRTDIDAIAAVAEQAGIPFIVDGVALLGKEVFTIPNGVTAMCFSGHKIHAPKGIGFSFIRKSLKLPPMIHGGSQEFSRRAGTENMISIVALAEAVRLLQNELPHATDKMQQLRDMLEEGLTQSLGEAIVTVNGYGPRICNTSNVSFQGIEGESLLMLLDKAGIAVSHGSACSSGALEPSRVLLQMGIPRHVASTAIRFSVSRFTTEAEIHHVVETMARLVRRQ